VNAGESNQSMPSGDSRGTVVVLSNDLFFGMRIRTVLRQLGYTVTIAKDVDAFQSMLEIVERTPVLGLIDFNQPRDWGALLPAIGAAKAAGVARVVSNGEFTRSLPSLVEKYAAS
jgi:CheY-like chemotaxis protein